MSIADLMASSDVRVFDLAQPLYTGAPSSPNHPKYQHSLWSRHGDTKFDDGLSSAGDVIVTGGHVGTHIDALSHISRNGLLYGDVVAADVEGAFGPGTGFSKYGVEEIDPIVCRGVLLDIARLKKKDRLTGEDEITETDLDDACAAQGVEVNKGDVILIHTGWGQLYRDVTAFLGVDTGVPGPGAVCGPWFIEHGVRAVGGETISMEYIPPYKGIKNLPLHRALLVESGIYIIEILNLAELAQAQAWEFLFVLAPLKVVGATGGPSRPLALVGG